MDNSIPFTFTKSGIYYFERRVPRDLLKHYSASKICYSLRTRSGPVALSRATRAAQQLDEYWYHLRIKDVDLPGRHLLLLQHSVGGQAHFDVRQEACADAAVPLSEAVSIYLKHKGKDRPVTFHRAAVRACGYVVDVCGDKDLTYYTKTDGNAFRDALVERKMAGSSITRIFGTVRAVINFAVSELGLTMTNPFAGVYYDRAAGVAARMPIRLEGIKELQSQCRRVDDEMRWLVALTTVCAARSGLGVGDWPRSKRIWDTFAQAYQSGSDLS